MENHAIIEILLVEDNPSDALLMQESLKRTRVATHVNVATDGEEALAFLHRQGNYESAPRPHIIILDLNLPRVHGLDVLRDVKTDNELKTIPVVILSGSTIAEDIHRAYHLHANCYLDKPWDLEGYDNLVNALENLFVDFVMLPDGRSYVRSANSDPFD